jgi:hypothetical protein
MTQQTDKELVREMVERVARKNFEMYDLYFETDNVKLKWENTSEKHRKAYIEDAIQLLLLEENLAIRVYEDGGRPQGQFDMVTHKYYHDVLLAPILNELLKEMR